MTYTSLHRPLKTCLGALALAVGAATSAAQVTVLTHPNQLSPNATIVIFNGVAGPITTQYLPLGVSFLLTDGQGAETFNDDTPRPFGPSAGTVITNLGHGNVGLEITFSFPVNRVAFEVRTAADEDAVVTLTSLAEGLEINSQVFNTGLAYTFVAEESEVGFDRVLLQTTGGGGTGVFLLDNLRFEAFADCNGAVFSEGFESQDLSQWMTLGPVGIVSSALGTAPATGQFQAMLATDSIATAAAAPVSAAEIEAFLGLPAGHLNTFVVTSATEGSAMARSFNVEAGDTLQFRWNFLTNEAMPANFSNDFAIVTLTNGAGQLLASTFTAGPRASVTPFSKETGIRLFGHQFSTTETVLIGFAVLNATDTNRESALLVDCILSSAESPINHQPVCSVDLTAAMNDFLEIAPGEFVVTEGQTFNASFFAEDEDADPITMTAAGVPATAIVTPPSGSQTTAAQFTWTPVAAEKALAPVVVDITFTDPDLEFCSKSVTIADVNLNPVCDAGGDANGEQRVECAGPDGTLVTLHGTAVDNDDVGLSYQWEVSDLNVVLDDPTSTDPTGLFPIGVTMVTLTVSDGRGGFDTSDVNVVVEDTTPPEVQATTNVAYLFPPDHTMRPVEIVIQANDACFDPLAVFPIVVTVTSSEPDDSPGLGDGETTGDVNGFDGFTAPVDVTGSLTPDPLVPGRFTGTILLRAELVIRGSGRTYVIDAVATDSAGNQSTTSCVVIVPDRRKS